MQSSSKSECFLSKAGNASPVTVLDIRIDTVVPGKPSISAPAYVNRAGAAAVRIGGTAVAGTTVRLAVSDAGAAHTLVRTVTADVKGEWVAPSLDLADLDDGALTFTAAVTDEAGNTGPGFAVSSIKDTLAPAAPNIAVPAHTAAESVGAIGGTAEQGAVVRWSASDDGASHSVAGTAMADDDGAWSAGSLDFSGFSEGRITYLVTAADSAGNISASAMATGSKDAPPSAVPGAPADPPSAVPTATTVVPKP